MYNARTVSRRAESEDNDTLFQVLSPNSAERHFPAISSCRCMVSTERDCYQLSVVSNSNFEFLVDLLSTCLVYPLLLLQ